MNTNTNTIKLATNYPNLCHSGESRNPENTWMPDQVRHGGFNISNCQINKRHYPIEVSIMSERQEIIDFLMEIIGEEGCGVSCKAAGIFNDDEGWKMMLEGFMEPWALGRTVAEAKAAIREYASMGFGLSGSTSAAR